LTQKGFYVQNSGINPLLLSIGLWMDKNGTILERKEKKKV